MKSFADVKNGCMFAVFNAKGTHKIEKKTGFFYAVSTATICKDIRLFKSHVSCYFSKVIVPLARMRGEQPFLFNSNFVDTMPKENEICKGTNNSSPSTTTNARKASTSKTEKLLKQLSDKVLSLQRDNEEKDRRIDYLHYYIAKSTPTMFSCFEKNHPIDSQDWKKLYKMQCQLNNI